MALLSILAVVATSLAIFVPAPAATAAVPDATADTAVVVVRTGGDRSAVGTAATLEGVRLELRRLNADDSVGAATGLSCTSDAQGDCVFIVTRAILAGGDDFAVVAPAGGTNTGPAADYRVSSTFMTNLSVGATGSSFESTQYRAIVRNVALNTVSRSGQQFMLDVLDNRLGSTGTWASPRVNPAAPQKCGLNIAVLSDLSTSVANAGATQTLKDAATSFVDALAGTPSTVSLFTFGTAISRSLPAQSTLSDAGLAALRTEIAAYTVPQRNGTNWDAGLWQMRNGDFDQIVVITDGNPTAYQVNTLRDGADTRFAEIESAIFSANALKSGGARIVTVGVGLGLAQDPANLAAISGPTENSDFYRTTDWSGLSSILRNLALENCRGSVTVVKKIVDWNATGTSGAFPIGGWQFDAATVGAGSVTPSAPTATINNQGQGDHGTINYRLEGIGTGTTFSLAEQQRPGFQIVPVGGANAECVRNGNEPLTVGANGPLGFSVPVGPNDVVTCTVFNRAPQPVATIAVDKQWVVNGVAQPLNEFPADFRATATLGAIQVGWGEVRELPIASVTVGESNVAVSGDFCTLDSQLVTAFNGQAITPVDVSGDNRYTTPMLQGGTDNRVTITNSVTCVSRLTLLKAVAQGVSGGDALPAAWLLTATPTAPNALPGFTGGTNISRLVTPGVAYTLTENEGPGGYELTALQCSANPNGPFTGASVSSVTLEPRQHLYCQFTNTAIPARLALEKVVTDGVVAPTNWTLTATGGDSVVSGAGGAPLSTVVAGRVYSLTETAVAGFDDSEFTAGTWSCTVLAGPGQGTVTTGPTVTPRLGQDIRCSIVNTATAVTPTFDKAAGTATAQPDGTWDVTYTLTVTNPSQVLPLHYDLQDAPQLPAGVEPVSAQLTLGGAVVASVDDWNGEAFGITGAELAAGAAPAVYTVTLTVTVPSTVDPSTLRCGEEGSGMFNVARLTPLPGTTINDSACVDIVPPVVEHDKQVVSVTQDPATGQWVIAYDVTVAATGSGVARYDLSDELRFGDGIDVVSASVAATGSAPAPVAGWTGAGATTTVVEDAVIAGGATHVYRVTVTASVAAGVTGTPAADCEVAEGETGTGFLNTATLVAGGESTEAEDCATPVVPEVEKSFVSATQNADASWAVEFVVAVRNPDATTGVVYSLSDTPGFADGVDIVDRAVTLNGDALAWDGSAPLATNRALAGGATDTYRLVFTVTVDPGIPTSSIECTEQGAGSGFFNSVRLTSGTETRDSDDCGPIEEGVVPLLEKTVDDGFPRQLPGGDWEIRYTVAVSTPEGTTQAARYDLDDALDFGAGVTIVSASATGPSGAIAGWTGVDPDVTLATDVLLPAGDTHEYTVLVRAAVPAGFSGSTVGDCVVDEEESGTGFRNTAVLTSGSAVREADDCGAPALPTLSKTVAVPVLGADGFTTITYEVEVDNPSDVDVVYDLVDELAFPTAGVTILRATVTAPDGVEAEATWDGVEETVVARDVELAADSTHVYVVAVQVRLSVLVEESTAACVADTPGRGYFNSAVVTAGADELTDDACAPITPPELPTLPLDPPGMALTGAEVGPLLLGALGLLLGGGLLLAVGARRRRTA